MGLRGLLPGGIRRHYGIQGKSILGLIRIFLWPKLEKRRDLGNVKEEKKV